MDRERLGADESALSRAGWVETMASIIRSPQAEQELDEIANYLALRSSRIALRFLDAVQSALDRLANFPDLGSLYETTNPQLQGVRVWPIPGFLSYLIFCRVVGTTVQVIRVLHGARDFDSLIDS